MRRILPILLLLALLCGCANEKTDATDGAIEPTGETVVSTYVSGSDMEQQTEGAVRQYRVGKDRITWVAPFQGGLLVASAGQRTTLQVISGLDGQIKATATLPLKLTENAIWQSTDTGFAYYVEADKQVVFLDMELKEQKKLQLPDTMTGVPAIAQSGGEVFYCEGQTVNGMDTELKIVRPIRTNTCVAQTLLGCYLNGSVIACNAQDDQNDWNTLYISSENGELLHHENQLERIDSYDNAYFVLRKDGITNQYIYGATDTTPMQLNIPDTQAFGALALGGVVGVTETDDGAVLNFYNMKNTASVTLPKPPKTVVADAQEQGVWLLTEDNTLLFWSVLSSPVEEDTDYTSPVYTAQAPDGEGLTQLAQRGNAMAKEHGVVIRIYERALVSNGDYNVEMEYQTHAIERTLDAVEAQLRKFPAKFLEKSVSGEIRICIVRSVGGEIKSAYHWYEGDPFIVLSAGMDVEKAFMDAFAYVLDIHVLGNTALADTWETLNPEGFAYGTENTVMAYLEGERQAFADRKGMQSVTDDRATVFYHAMLADNAEVFQSETMQAKLKMLCEAIRDAWDLEKSSEIFLWEQYLNP